MVHCEFSTDYCHWSVEASDQVSGFVFDRVTAADLQQSGIAGPVTSHFGKNDDPFVFVTANGTVDEKGTVTIIKSPLLKGKEHPEECFHFWFDFRVSVV